MPNSHGSINNSNSRPISEGEYKGNTNPRPEGQKPVATAKPQGRPTASNGSGSQGTEPNPTQR